MIIRSYREVLVLEIIRILRVGLPNFVRAEAENVGDPQVLQGVD